MSSLLSSAVGGVLSPGTGSLVRGGFSVSHGCCAGFPNAGAHLLACLGLSGMGTGGNGQVYGTGCCRRVSPMLVKDKRHLFLYSVLYEVLSYKEQILKSFLKTNEP